MSNKSKEIGDNLLHEYIIYKLTQINPKTNRKAFPIIVICLSSGRSIILM